MKFFDKIKKFIRRIFVDYGDINWMIEEHSRIRSEEVTKRIIEENSNSIQKMKNEFNDDISEILEKLEKLEKLTERINNEEAELKNTILEVNEKLEQIKYNNSELQNIEIDKNFKNILIVGFYGAPNLGDELMLETVLDYLEDVENKKITILLADNPKYSIDKYKDVRFLHYPRTLCDFNVLAEQYDYVIFGGGAIIDDKQYEKEKSYQYDLGTILIKLAIRAIAFNKKVICLALSASQNINNEEYLDKLKYVIEKSEFFSVRDSYTKQYLEEKLGKEISEKIVEINDIVLSNKKILPNIRKERKISNDLNIGVVFISNDNNIEKLNIIIDAISKLNKKCNINLIPFYDYNEIDIRFYDRVRCIENSDIKINIEKYSENMSETIELFNKNDIIIGMRYHSILLADILNIPCISINYDIHEHYYYKIKYLNEIFEQEQALSYLNLDTESVFNRLKDVTENKNQKNIFSISEKITQDATKQIKTVIDKLINK
ncbi:MAG: polysaccharide pyruvyl transferase family protein [Clostridia bacterium]|nr:polysaccharide pyruvyl transferase family protein [Clostridia bacterium]